jgi:hypothetical protein
LNSPPCARPLQLSTSASIASSRPATLAGSGGGGAAAGCCGVAAPAGAGGAAPAAKQLRKERIAAHSETAMPRRPRRSVMNG